jgi:hypothetical protein
MIGRLICKIKLFNTRSAVQNHDFGHCDRYKNANSVTLYMSIIRLEKLLKSGSQTSLDNIIQRAQKMDELTSTIQAALPQDLAENLLSANLRADAELVLVCSSSAWAARLRFESEKLLEIVNRNGATAKSCRVSVSQGT